MRQLIYPNFKKNIINISTSFAKYLGVETSKYSNPTLDSELLKNYKNVIFIIFDGLGKNPIDINLNPESYLSSNIKEYLTSTYPSTTTNATTSFMSNLYPIEHGWFAWSLYFKDINKALDIFTGRNSITKEIYDKKYMYKHHDFIPFFEQKKKSDIKTYTIFPKFIFKGRNTNTYTANTINSLFTTLRRITKIDDKKFIYCYCDEPDKDMHEHGVSSPLTKNLIEFINDKVKNFMEKEKDTLLVISADHGMVDIRGHIYLYQDELLLSYLRSPLFFDGRTPGFNLRPNCEYEFLEYMNAKYGGDMVMLSKKFLLDKGVFGPGSSKNSELIPDYVGIVTSDKDVVMSPKSFHSFKAHHSSMSTEMHVPLIIIGKK